MLGLIIFTGVFFILLTVLLYFFCVAFVKRNMGNFDDVNDPCNNVLGEFKARVGKSIEQVKDRDFKWVETVSFDGLKLSGRYFDNGFKNTVLLFHGYRSSALRDMACAVEMYSSLGFNALLVDQRSHGRSEGRLITFGVKESRDVLSWISFVTEKYAPEKIILGGMSMGAATVLLAAGESLPKTVSAVVADCGYTSPEDIITCVSKTYLRINPYVFMPFLNGCCRLIGKFSFRGVSTVESLKKCQIPVMLIHGEADDFVPCRMSREAFESCNKDSWLLTIADARHGMSFLVDEDRVRSEIKEFLIKSGSLQSFH